MRREQSRVNARQLKFTCKYENKKNNLLNHGYIWTYHYLIIHRFLFMVLVLFY